jgi:hypothetical protein
MEVPFEELVSEFVAAVHTSAAGAVALMALDGDASIRWREALDHMERLGRESASPLARAWIGACLLQYRGVRPEWGKAEPPDRGDILVDAVESISWNRIMAAG